jgi:hypothetical protein
MGMLRRWAGIPAALAIAAPMLITAPATAVPASSGTAHAISVHADDYPSWSQVQEAKKRASTARAELQRIRGLVVQLQQAADKALAVQLAKAAAYTQAQAKLAAATTRANALSSQAEKASARAERARLQFGRLAAQMYVSGSSDVTARLLLSTGADSDLLDRLGAMSQLTGQISTLQQTEKAERNVADSLSAQAAEAQRVRTGLAADAKKKLAAAEAAKQQADAVLAEQQRVGATLTAQAASLAHTAVSTEKKYQQGVAYRAQQASSGGSNGYIDTSGVVVDPAAAQAYARGRLGAYGWGSGQFGCLVDLWTMESGWRADAYNTSSGAYGIPQAWPANKMSSAGSDWMTNADTQINWGLTYIASSYGTPCGAWNFEMSHDPHWY